MWTDIINSLSIKIHFIKKFPISLIHNFDKSIKIKKNQPFYYKNDFKSSSMSIAQWLISPISWFIFYFKSFIKRVLHFKPILGLILKFLKIDFQFIYFSINSLLILMQNRYFLNINNTPLRPMTMSWVNCSEAYSIFFVNSISFYSKAFFS